MKWNWGTYGHRCYGYDPMHLDGRRYFVAYFWFVGWWCPINIGFHIDLIDPNIEIHIPFGFFRIGWERNEEDDCTGKEN